MWWVFGCWSLVTMSPCHNLGFGSYFDCTHSIRWAWRRKIPNKLYLAFCSTILARGQSMSFVSTWVNLLTSMRRWRARWSVPCRSCLCFCHSACRKRLSVTFIFSRIYVNWYRASQLRLSSSFCTICLPLVDGSDVLNWSFQDRHGSSVEDEHEGIYRIMWHSTCTVTSTQCESEW